MVLIDTSVWIEHFRKGISGFADLLEEGKVVCHPFIVGELACGNLKNRAAILALLEALPMSPAAEHDEVLAFIAGNKLMGKGLGYVDAHLLASAVLAGLPLWTLDKNLARAAASLHLQYRPKTR